MSEPSLLEQSFRQSMTMSGGSLSVFVGSDITILLLIFSIAALVLPPVLSRMLTARRRRSEAVYDGAGDHP